MNTADDHYVSALTGLCEHHAEQFANMLAQVLDAPTGDTAYDLSIARAYLEEERATCLEQCGRNEP